jgi:hypothetical protein
MQVSIVATIQCVVMATAMMGAMVVATVWWLGASMVAVR